MKKGKLNRKDYIKIERIAFILRIILTPIFLIIRTYYWVWDYDYLKKFDK